jgi:predicted glycosyltransferase involved in capsule biosynthesis
MIESVGEKFRPGSGLLVSKTLVFKMLKGYDEGYVGGGAEDIDFIHRAMETLGVVIVESFAHIIHQTHEVRSERLEANALNEERFRRVRAGEDVGFTSILVEKD